MKKISKVEAIIIVLLILIVGKFFINIIFCNGGTETSYTADEAVSKIENADEIQIKKNYRSLFIKDYYILVNGECVATISGKFFKILGDEFVMESSNGETILSEKEEKLHLNRQAQFFDSAGNETYRYESKFFSILNNSILYDMDHNKVLDSKQQFSLPRYYLINNNKDEEIAKISKDNIWFDNYTINTNSIENKTILTMICAINDAVATPKGNSNKSKSSK